MIRFHKTYFAISVIIFILECVIAKYCNDSFIRPYFGDFLVVILMYTALKTFLQITPVWTGTITILVSFAIEFSQYFHLTKALNIEDNPLATLILGSSYSNLDLLLYLLGTITIYWIDVKVLSKK